MIRSIGARLAVWYALAATITLACLFLAGYRLLETRLLHGLDLLNASEFREIKARLGNNVDELDLQFIDEHIRETTEYASVLFYINVHNPKTNMLFYSTNLNGVEIPDVPGEHIYNAELPGAGPVRVSEFILGALDVVIATPAVQVQIVMEGYVEVCAALLIAMLLVSGAIGYGLARLALRPVRLISETALHIGSDNLNERIPVASVHDEISDLARLLNAMFDRLESSFNQIRRFSADASHELKTPLSLVRLHAEKLLFDSKLTAAQEDALQIQLEELARLDKIIDQLLFLSRAEVNAIKLDLMPHDPAIFLRGFVQDARALIEHQAMQFDFRHHGQGKIPFDGKWIRQVLLNLITNAIKASPPNGRIALVSILAKDTWQVSVEDQGSGVAPDQYERIFERFVRLTPSGSKDDKGNGLGLSICRSIVMLHGGRIFAKSGNDGIGLRVVFEI